MSEINQPTVLVLDADQRAALAVTRSLGKAGIRVLTADVTAKTLAGASRYAAAQLVYPSPRETPEAFIRALRNFISFHSPSVLLPITDITAELTLRHAEELGPVRLPFPDYDTFMAVTDKYRLYATALELGVRVPRSVQVVGGGVPTTDLPLPAVVKPVRSVSWGAEAGAALEPQYADSQSAVHRLLQRPELNGVPLLIQERIEGEGRGVFVLCDRGRPVAHFAHRRLREKPPSGGVSVLCESLPLDPDMCAVADRLLAASGWHGVAMVEFKMDDKRGQPCLLEVNGRFWGSLQLAVDAGVDFPVLLYRMAMGQPYLPPESYKVGRRSRWLLGDVDHLLLTLKAGPLWPPRMEIAGKAGALLLESLRPRTRLDVMRLRDPAPALYELRRYGSAMMSSLGRFVRRRKRRSLTGASPE